MKNPFSLVLMLAILLNSPQSLLPAPMLSVVYGSELWVDADVQKSDEFYVDGAPKR